MAEQDQNNQSQPSQQTNQNPAVNAQQGSQQPVNTNSNAQPTPNAQAAPQQNASANTQPGQYTSAQTYQQPNQNAYTQQSAQYQASSNQGQSNYWQQPVGGQTQTNTNYQPNYAPNQQYQPIPAQPVRESDSSLTLGTWVVTILLSMIPIVNIIMLFIWGFDSTTAPARRNYAHAQLIWMAVGIVLTIIFWGVIIALVGQVSDYSSMYGYEDTIGGSHMGPMMS